MAGKLHLRLSNYSSCCLPADLHCFKEIRPVVHHYQECLVPDDKQIRGDLARRKFMWFKILSSLCWAICLADCAMRNKVSYFSPHSWPMQNFTSTGEPILQCQCEYCAAELACPFEIKRVIKAYSREWMTHEFHDSIDFKEIRPVVHHYQECLVPDDKQIRGDLARRKFKWFKILSSLCWAICLADCHYWLLLPNPAIRKSSAITSTPSTPSTNSCTVRCHTSDAAKMPNGIMFHRTAQMVY